MDDFNFTVEDEDSVESVTESLEASEAAPGPFPTAGTEPTCFEGSAVMRAAVNGEGSGSVPTGSVDMAAMELSLFVSGSCISGTIGMED